MKRWVILAAFLVVVSLAGSLALGLVPSLYERLPERIPVHWGLSGEPDGWIAKADWWKAFLLMPGIMGLLFLLMLALPWLSPRQFTLDRFRPTYGYIMFLVILMMAYIHFAAMLGGVLAPSRVSQLILGGICLFFALIGNVLGKVKRNFYVGIRTPWTLASEKVWVATHRLGAWAFTTAGVLGLVLIVAGLPAWCGLILILPAALVPVMYSLVLYKRLEKRGELDVPAASGEEVPVT